MRLFEKEALEGHTKIHASKPAPIESVSKVIRWHKELIKKSKKGYKPVFSTQYHIEPELSHCELEEKDRTCGFNIRCYLDKYSKCLGCKHWVTIIKEDKNGNEIRSDLQKSRD